MKKSFVMYTDWSAAFAALTDEQSGKLVKAFFAYHNDEPIELDLTLSVLFNAMFLPVFKRNAESYEEICRVRKSNGMKGGAPRGNKNACKVKTSKTTENNHLVELETTKTTKNKQNNLDNDNEYDNDKDNVYTNSNSNIDNEKAFLAFKESYQGRKSSDKGGEQ